MNGRSWLTPLGALFGGAAALRAALYARGLLRRARLRGPVISVGNLGVGGSGKTPAVAWIAGLLRDEGLPVAILSRGYGGRHREAVLLVSDGTTVFADAAAAGDEPVMLARTLPGVVVAVGRRRDVVGRAVEDRFGPRVHVLDDGFQHLRLARDLDVLCLGAEDLRDRPLPAGRLRERPAAASRADVVLLTGEAPRDGSLPAAVPVSRRSEGFFTVDGAPRPAPARPFAFSALARPERFESDLRGLVTTLAGARRFRDHHRYTATDGAALVGAAQAAGADALVTTAKDAVRLPPALLAAPALPLLVLRMSLALANDDARRFRERLLAVARRAA